MSRDRVRDALAPAPFSPVAELVPGLQVKVKAEPLAAYVLHAVP
jgi:hypothetical protein